MNQILYLSETEIAWLAGLFEGEAYFNLDKRSKKRYINSEAPPAPFIKIAMIDEDIISRVAKLLNKNYYIPSRLTSTGKKVYICHIGDRVDRTQKRDRSSHLHPFRTVPMFGQKRLEIIVRHVLQW